MTFANTFFYFIAIPLMLKKILHFIYTRWPVINNDISKFSIDTTFRITINTS